MGQKLREHAQFKSHETDKENTQNKFGDTQNYKGIKKKITKEYLWQVTYKITVFGTLDRG